MKVSLKKLLLFVGIIIIGLMFANVSNAAVKETDYFTVDYKNWSSTQDYDSDYSYYFSIYDEEGSVFIEIDLVKTGGGGAYTDEDLQSFVNDFSDEGVEMIESKLTKISGASTMMLKYKETEYEYCTALYFVRTDNYRAHIYCYADYLYQLNSQECNEILNSIKIKDTIALQNDEVPFNDVSNKQWYHAPIKYVYEKGYISGLNAYTYGPNVNLSRCMLVTILWRISGNPAAKGNVSFPDIKESDWYYTPVIWAAENGIVNGYGNGKFGPNDNISREQLATMLRNYSIFRGKDSSYTASSVDSFHDSKKIADWAVPGVAWAVKNQIIGGKNSGTIVDPQGNATRAEVATMIMKLDTNVLK